MADPIDTFKQYVPAEILATFITVNTLLPPKDDRYSAILLGVIVVLMVFFVAYALIKKRFTSNWVLAVITLMLPFWCYVTAPERFITEQQGLNLQAIVSVVLVMVSLGLTLFAPNPAAAATPPPVAPVPIVPVPVTPVLTPPPTTPAPTPGSAT